MMNDIIEYRQSKAYEIRAKEGEKMEFAGYAAVFNELSEEIWGFREKIDKGAFRQSMQADDIRALLNHDVNFVLGRNRAGTLILSEDDHGLAVRIMPPDTEWVRGLKKSIERKDITEMSFGFRVKKQSWDESNLNNVVRTLQAVELVDVSIVTYPAYPQTEVDLRAKSYHAYQAIRQGNIESMKRKLKLQEVS